MGSTGVEVLRPYPAAPLTTENQALSLGLLSHFKVSGAQATVLRTSPCVGPSC